jgi:hypothetical protein
MVWPSNTQCCHLEQIIGFSIADEQEPASPLGTGSLQ